MRNSTQLPMNLFGRLDNKTWVFLMGFVLSGCLTKQESDLKIVNGSTDTNHWSYQHSVDIRTMTKEASGVIIADRWILTANHTFEGASSKIATVHFGPDANNPIAKIKGRVISHEGYVGGKYLTEAPNDIALIELESSIPSGFSPAPILKQDGVLTKVKKIGNPNVNKIGGKNLVDLFDHYGLNDVTDGSGNLVLPIIVSGYGVSKLGDYSSVGTFRFADMPLYGEEPSMNFIHVGYPKHLFPNIQNRPERKGTCDGDSGGPAFRYYGPQHYALIGVDFGRKASSNCGEVTLYTDVRKYLPWIQQKIGNTALRFVPGAEAAGDYMISDAMPSTQTVQSKPLIQVGSSSYGTTNGNSGTIYGKPWSRDGDRITYDFEPADIAICHKVEKLPLEECNSSSWRLDVFERVIGDI